MTFIMRTIENVLSVMVSRLVTIATSANASATASTRKLAGWKRLAARAKNDQDAGEPGNDRHETTARHRFVQERNREQRDPGGRRELEREDGCERQEGEGECPAVGAGEMQDVAQQMQLDPSRPQLRTQIGSDERESEKQDNAHSVADGKDLEDRKGGRQVTHRDGGRREREQRSGHPENDRQDFRDWHV